MLVFLVCICLFLAASAQGSLLKGLLTNPDAVSTGREWISLSEKEQFQPADFSGESPRNAALMQNSLRRLLDRDGDYSSIFVDGAETYYDEYSQAWRYLGFYIDCNQAEDGYHERLLQEDESYTGCLRYLMWAAYVDLDYEGGGIGEYSFYNRHEGTWDTTSCIAADGRCAPMDCHLPETNFKLLGVFKEQNFGQWMEQLFKHEGICVWTDEEYEFMQDERRVWPEGCTMMGITDESGNYLYVDLKPQAHGFMDVGVYTDAQCIQDYTGEESHLALIEKEYENNNDDGDGQDDDGNLLSLETYIEKWNDAFNIFKYCQPCRAYDLGWNTDLTDGEDRQGGQDDEDGNGSYFTCKDDAGYRNVNQCMKFKTKTDMQVAYVEDIILANNQGTINYINVQGNHFGTKSILQSSRAPMGLLVSGFLLSLVVAGVGVILFVRAWKKLKEANSSLSEPLHPEGELA
jgi:hypothetical protein